LSVYFKIRETLRLNPCVQRLVYTSESLRYALRSSLSDHIRRRADAVPALANGVAVCLRIKDEAPFLAEWLDYHAAAGIEHFFIYESFSSDNFREVLQPYVDRGTVTLISDWPYVPVTPYAERDCILRALNRFEWVGFLDVDEFLAIADGSGIGEFLSRFPDAPAVAFHWFMYGSSGHKIKPAGSVIQAYTFRCARPDQHVKVFVRPGQVTHCRNPHSWQYKSMRHAISEAGQPIYGSFSMKRIVRNAWIAHFFCKSEDEYRAKMTKREDCDRVAQKFKRRSEESLRKTLVECNQVEDLSVQNYYRRRCEALSISPELLSQ
jgi:hypothetical protein